VLFRPQSGNVRSHGNAASSDLMTTSADDVSMVADQQTLMAAHVDCSYHLLSRGRAARRVPGAA
jgi:hypothetical protein